jgi:aldehyde oxidoreductase
MAQLFWLNVNGRQRSVLADPEETLATVLREQLGLTGVKVGCDGGHCGACSVLLDGKVVRSCITRMGRLADGATIVTIEGIGTPEHLHPLQVAWINHGGVQCGFCSPGFIVSAKGLLDENPAPTRDEVRAWFQKHRNVCRCTGYKSLVDCVMEAAKVLRGEMTIEELGANSTVGADGHIWNTHYPRPSALSKVTGTCHYGADLGLQLPKDTLHIALVQPEVSHATLLSIDTAEAEKMPGVHKVVTHKDVTGTNRIAGLLSYPASKCDGFERPILCDTKIFQYGDVVAMVLADTKKQAEAAAKKVKVELEKLPAYMDCLDAAAEDAIEIHPGTPNVFFEVDLKKGDHEHVDELIASAPYSVEGDFYTQRQPHMTIEPDVGFGYLDEDGVVTVHSKSIALYMAHLQICEGLGLAPEKLRLIQNPQGGNFGYKIGPTLEALCAVATMASGHPCFLQYNYKQHMVYTGKRAPCYSNMRMAADKDGKLVAMDFDLIMDHGAYSEFADELLTKACRYSGAGFYLPAIDGHGRTTFTNHTWVSAFRAYGGPQGAFSTNLMMDELAEKCGLDTWEFMNRNVLRDGDTLGTGEVQDVYPLPQLMEMIKPEYDAAVERCAKLSTPAKKRGVGLAVGIYNVGNDVADLADSDIELNPDGSVTVYNTWEDPGQGADIGTLATAHEALRPLGLAPEQIHLYMNDTARCPDSGAAAGSRSQYMVGNAIVDSCDQLIKAMTKADGTYRTHAEMVAEGIATRHNGHFSAAPLCSSPEEGTFQFSPHGPVPTMQYGVFMAEVEVDTATGTTAVLKMALDSDIGVIANRQAVEGQMYGGLVQGIGLALSEDFVDLKKHTTILAGGIPYIKDAPDELELGFLETPRATGPFGAGGCGELPLYAPHAAIINAIYHACGARVTHLPARPEKVLAALKAL